MLSELSCVKIKVDVPEYGLKKGMEGVIVDIVKPKKSTDMPVYTVELYDENGDTIRDSIWPYFLEEELEPIQEQNL